MMVLGHPRLDLFVDVRDVVAHEYLHYRVLPTGVEDPFWAYSRVDLPWPDLIIELGLDHGDCPYLFPRQHPAVQPQDPCDLLRVNDCYGWPREPAPLIGPNVGLLWPRSHRHASRCCAGL